MKPGMVAFLSDFGTQDAYAGVLHGTVARVAPQLRTLDVTHGIPNGDIAAAAYALWSAWEQFPEGTLFCGIVDPGVGGNRGTLAAERGDRWFLGPDNGMVTLARRFLSGGWRWWSLDTERIQELSHPERPNSTTFHGRDLFAPAAALLACGERSILTSRNNSPVVLTGLEPWQAPDEPRTRWHAPVLCADHFGNVITTLSRNQIPPGAGLQATLCGIRFPLSRTYASVSPGAALAYWGSMNLLELALNQENLRANLGADWRDEALIEITT